jgi:Tfp pilus assembly protein PilF
MGSHKDINAVLRALATDPNSADLTLGAAILYNARGNNAASAEYYRRFQALAPNSPIAKH